MPVFDEVSATNAPASGCRPAQPPRPMQTEQGVVLVVDDDARFRTRLVEALERRGFAVLAAAGADAALTQARQESPDYALVDLRLGNDSGLSVVRALHALDTTLRIVVLTGFGSIATALDAVRSGAVHYLTKPAELDEIIAAFDSDGAPSSPPPAPTVPSLDRVEWEHIERVLAECGGNVTRAAELLGIHRRSLQRKMARHPSDR